MLNNFPRLIISILSEWGFTRQGFRNNSSGEWWLIAQIILILAHFFPAYISLKLEKINWPMSSLGLYIIILGIFLAIMALSSLGKNISPLPDPKKGAKLIRIGSYKYCRHPLYQSILICSLGSIIYLDSLMHIILFIGLSLVLKGKALREEEMLLKIHPDYNSYRKSTPAIIPWIPLLDWR